MAFLDDLASVLQTAGVGTIGTDIFLSSAAVIPQGNGPYITLAETGGMAPTRVANYRVPNTQRPTAQVLVRASTYPAARTMIDAAYFALDGIFNATLSGTFYLSVTARQEPTDMGFDSTGRLVQIVFEINAEKQPS